MIFRVDTKKNFVINTPASVYHSANSHFIHEFRRKRMCLVEILGSGPENIKLCTLRIKIIQSVPMMVSIWMRYEKVNSRFFGKLFFFFFGGMGCFDCHVNIMWTKLWQEHHQLVGWNGVFQLFLIFWFK